MSAKMKKLPIEKDIETKQVLKKLTTAHRALAELKGVVSSIPNENILINTLGLQEAKDSSAIENIITTHDNLYKAELKYGGFKSANAKEVQNYIVALKRGFQLASKHKIITSNSIIKIQAILENSGAGFRKLPGTTIKNTTTGETVLTPPQNYDQILELMTNLEFFINDDTISDFDPLVKMAIIHHQFESIHPFYDGNGRTGRIINVLYLVIKGLLGIPVLYLSRYLIKHKADYYRLLQEVRELGIWEEWLLYILDGVEQTAKETLVLIDDIKMLIFEYKNRLRDNYKFYSQDLLNNLFKHPYTKIEFVQKDLGVSRITAANYLNFLSKDGLLEKHKLGTGNYYINERLFKLLTQGKLKDFY